LETGALRGVGFGLKGTPKRSARAFIACCSAVRAGVSEGSARAAGA
jgi:hypothetical protein